jgi:hypothetical protein
MKREILCKKCEAERRKLFPTESPYPGEHIKFVKGIAKSEMVCDGCVILTEIHKGDEICAFSIWADYGGIAYHAWEFEFLKII